MVAGGLRTEKESRERASQSASAPLFLEMGHAGNQGEAVPLAVRIKSLSARGVILTGQLSSAGDLPDKGQAATIHLPAQENGGLTHIRTTLLWTRPGEAGEDQVLLGLALDESNLKTRQALEAYLPQYPKDLKGLWDHWDQVQEDLTQSSPVVLPLARPGIPPAPTCQAAPAASAAKADGRPSSSADLPIYLVGLGAGAAGLGLYTLGPDSYQVFGAILAIYGSLTMAGRSLWTMWLRKAAPAE